MMTNTPPPPPLAFKRVEPIAEVLERYRIVNNGESGDRVRFKVQRRGWFCVWRDCSPAGHYMAIYHPSIGIYRTEDDAIAALTDLASQETENQLTNF